MKELQRMVLFITLRKTNVNNVIVQNWFKTLTKKCYKYYFHQMWIQYIRKPIWPTLKHF